jgi:ATP-binding cassette, subfamily B, multidrug efflux pump
VSTRSPVRPPSRSQAALARFHEEVDVRTADLSILKRLWPTLRPHGALLVTSMVLLCVVAALALVRPLIMKSGLDALDQPDAVSQITRAGVILTVVLVIEQALAFPQMYLMQVAGARSMADLRRTVFDFLHTRSLGFFDRTPVGRLVTRVTNDIDAIGEMFGSGALNAFGDLIRLVVIVVVMLSMDWRMSLIAFATVPPVALGVAWVRPRLRRAFREVRSKTARMNALLNEQVSGMSVVQAYAREADAAAEFDTINEAYRRANNTSIIYDASLDAAIEMISSICIASVLWYAGVRSLAPDVSFGTLFAFVAYIEMFFLPIRDLSARYTLMQSAMTGAERVFDLMDNDEVDAPGGGVEQGDDLDARESDSAFELQDVTFAYKPGVPVLLDVSLVARRGEKVALVGATGAGKSTVASLLLRLYDAGAGTVRVAGRDVKKVSRRALRSQFAVVPQDVFLFPGTLASNVAAGDETPDLELVRRALSKIDALEVFERREGGLLAPVLERGANFSAGERQLIAFARALYRDPPILIFDEATANVDSETEARLQRAVEGAMAGRTALTIAHRLSTIRAADRIVVFHRGRVVEQGSHDALLAQDGLYARLYRLQFSREAPVLETGS